MLLSCISVTVNAQARTGSVEYQKVARAALINEIPFPSKTIENALIQDFGKAGYKSSKSQGFIVFKGVRLTALGPDAYDLYFSSERVSRKEKDNSTVTLLISKGFDAFADESKDAQLFENGAVKATSGCDAYWVDVALGPGILLRQTTYWFGLLTHRRASYTWKGLSLIHI